jgi:DNA end-binding protein Ku
MGVALGYSKFSFRLPCIANVPKRRTAELWHWVRRVWRRRIAKGVAMASSVWKGAISFGLLSIPIRLYTAARSERTSLHQLHEKCRTRLRQPLFCPTCNRIVSRDEVVKGFEYEKGHYVLVDQADLKKITPESGRSMEILAFVEKDQVDPIYFDTSYLALPEKDADKPYQLLLKALEDTNRLGVARFVMHQREYMVFVRPRDGGLTVHTMYFLSEIRSVPKYGEKPKNLQLKPAEIKLAEQLVESLAEDFHPAQYHDTYQDDLRALVEAKQKGKTFAERAAPKRAQVIDMMDALKRSVRESGPSPKRLKAAPRRIRRAS